MLKYRIQSILFVLVAFMLGCNEYMIVGVLKDIHSDMGTPLATLGILVTLFALVYSICTPFISLLSARFKRHNVLFALLVIFLVANTWTAIAPNFISLLLSRVLAGETAGSIISITVVMASFIAPPEKKAALISWVFAGFSIANVAGVPIGNTIARVFSWRDSFWMVTILTVIIFVLLFIYAPKDTPQSHAGTPEEAAKISADRKKYIVHPITITNALFIICVTAAQYSFYTYITEIITKYLHFTDSVLSILLFILGIVSIFGNKLGGYYADRGNMQDIPFLYVIMPVSLVLIGLLINLTNPQSFPLILGIIGFVLIAIVCIVNVSYGANVTVLFLDLANEQFPGALDLSSTFNPVFSNFGIAVGSFVSSMAIGSGLFNIGNIVFISAIFGFCSLALVLRLKKLTKEDM